ncbi:7TM diverse intracellular signaling domain-containing protein [Sulfurimonas sp. HSL-1716]|uniref:sensor histidine kinase n=1 Tax=Hydrocurvibacter sulfurireducens TaxID=3131937 RepID=UPI0031F8A6A6
MSLKRLSFDFFFFLLLFVSLSAKIYAFPITDVRNLSKPQELYGPWAYTPTIVAKSDDNRLNKQQMLLPKFVESILKSSKGAFTFAIKLKTTPNKPLSINLRQPFSIWKLYVDGKLAGSSGKFNTAQNIYKAQAYYPIVSFTPKTTTTTLMLYLANAQHQHIGFYEVPVIAPKGMLEQQRLLAIYIQLVITAILCSFAIYHIGLFLAWRQDKAPLWFGLLSFSLALRAAVTGEKVLLQFFPYISWETLLRLEYVSGYIALPLFVLYIGSLYPKQTSKSAERVYLATGALFLSFALFFPTIFFTSTLQTYEILVITFIFYTVWILFQSYRSKEKGSSLALGAFLIFSAAVIHDLLMFENIIRSSSDLMPYGFSVYLLAQAVILLLRYADAFRLIESHTGNLEKLIADRTSKLRNLVSQRELLLRELTHRVKNNLQLILGFLWIQRKEANEDMNASLRTLESQVKAISSVHEALCTQSNINAIEMNNYIHRVVSSLQQLYPDLTIIFNEDIPIFIETDHAVSLGLIVNELIANHIKYADLNTARAIILQTTQTTDQEVVLSYNDGIDHSHYFSQAEEILFGLPKFGWSMIKKFIKQMNASIAIHSDHIKISFAASETL